MFFEQKKEKPKQFLFFIILTELFLSQPEE